MNRQIINRRYRVEQRIGEGATAEVYLGFDIVLNRRVAIKTLRSQHSTNRAFRLRFEREAQSAARFSHPNIISIFDVGEDHGLPYIIMEYIDGQTLREIIQEEGPFHPDDVAVLVEQVAAGLDYAHQHGLVHRDIKPENILVDRHGLAKVVDFGIARGLSDSTLTETGSGIGTVHYISPEQASGLMATPESDIYSLGVIAFEMLTGELPFESESAVGLAMRHLNDPVPDPASVNPDVPPEAADIVLQALEKNPTRRYPTAGAFSRALTDWRLYEPLPRLAAKYVVPRETEPLRYQRDDVTAVLPGYQDQAHPESVTAAPVPTQPYLPYDEDTGNGGKSWIAGFIAVASIAAVLWYGFGLSDRINGSSGDETATAINESAVATESEVPGSAGDSPTATTASMMAGIPNVVGLAQADAEADLSNAGFTMALGDPIPSDEIAEGKVALQNPGAKSALAEGGEVTIHLSTGSVRIDFAALNVEGRSVDEVTTELTSNGISVELVDEGSESIPEGSVIRLEPGNTASPGDVVTAFVSKGDRVQIPFDLQGQPMATARTRLGELGLVVDSEIGVSRATIENAGLDLAANEIADGDIVGIQDNDAQFGGWVIRESSVSLVYYDADRP